VCVSVSVCVVLCLCVCLVQQVWTLLAAAHENKSAGCLLTL